jgi:hypothetical protein
LKLLLMIMLLLQPTLPDGLWDELRGTARRVSADFGHENWVYRVTWQSGFSTANEKLLEYYTRKALSPAAPVSSQAPLVAQADTGLLEPDSLPQLRKFLSQSGAMGLLNFIVRNDGGDIWIVCQVIHSQADKDTLLSARTEVTPDLAVILNQPGTSETGGEGSLRQRIYIDETLLAVVAGDFDPEPGLEVAALTTENIIIFISDEGRFRLGDKVSLRSLRSSYYPHRVISGRLYTVPASGRGETETLLVNANIFRNGALFNSEAVPRLRELSTQPLPAATRDQPEQENSWLSGRYVPGEDNRTIVTPVAAENEELPGSLVFRDFLPIINQDASALALTRENSFYILDISENLIQQLPSSPVAVKHVFRAERSGGELLVWSVVEGVDRENGDNGADRITLYRLGLENRPLTELRSDLDIIDAALYNSEGQQSDLIIAGRTKQKAFVLEHHALSGAQLQAVN